MRVYTGTQIERVIETLLLVKDRLITLGGDPRATIEFYKGKGDVIQDSMQSAVLDDIDAELETLTGECCGK